MSDDPSTCVSYGGHAEDTVKDILYNIQKFCESKCGPKLPSPDFCQ